LSSDSNYHIKAPQMGEPIDKNLWGELEPEEGLFLIQSFMRHR